MGQQSRGRQREGRQAGEEQETGKQTSRQGLDNRRGGQTGEGSVTGRISVVETVQELRESTVSRPTRDDLAETEWRERIYLEGSPVKVVGLIRGDQGGRPVNGKTRGGP